jgi:hypothetical protein
MNRALKKTLVAVALAGCVAPLSTRAQLIISEVDAAGSSASYGADWFEVVNTGPLTINLTGWKMDDNSASFGSAVAIRGITSIAPGQAVIFLEGNATGTTDATINSAFTTAWFGGSPPPGLTLANYGGSGVGLSTTADAVNLFDSGGVLQASVSFGASTPGFTFDNAQGLNNTTISQVSAVGVNGAFTSANSAEVGSPSVVPEPGTMSLLTLAGAGLFALRRFARK